MKTSNFFRATICCLLLLLCGFHVQATHLRGGYITYTVDAQNYRKYHFKMALFANEEATADHPSVTIHSGDAVSYEVSRTSATSLGNKVLESTYEWDYIFPADGTFSVFWNGINRNAGILNLQPPTEQISMVVQTTVTVNALVPTSHGTDFLSKSFAIAYVGKPFVYNLLAYAQDADSLAYSLAVPQQIPTAGEKAGSIVDVPGYQAPAGMTINKYGEISWPNPPSKGEYAVAVQVKEYKNKQLVSTTVNNVQLLVTDAEQVPAVMLLNQEHYTTVAGSPVLLVQPGKEATVRFFIKKPEASTLQKVTVASELLLEFNNQNLRSTTSQRDSADGVIQQITFEPGTSLQRTAPYGLGADAALEDLASGYNMINQHYVYVVVGNQMPTGLKDLPKEDLQAVYPNPATNQFMLETTAVTGKLTVYAADGRIVWQTSLKPGKNQLTRPASLAPGYYTYYVQNQGRVVQRGRLVLQ